MFPFFLLLCYFKANDALWFFFSFIHRSLKMKQDTATDLDLEWMHGWPEPELPRHQTWTQTASILMNSYHLRITKLKTYLESY